MKSVDHNSIDTWIICFMGFMTHEGQASGIERLHDRLHRTFSAANCRVVLRSWRDSIQHSVQRILRWEPDTGYSKIFLIGHSYGGYSALLTAKELDRYGRKVELLGLIDAVWRPKCCASLASLYPGWKLKVTENVRQVVSYYQQESRPRGHQVVVNPDTTSLERYQLYVPHARIDEDRSVWSKLTSTIYGGLNDA